MANGADQSPTEGVFSLGRLATFSDAVIAIAITLLVLGLEVPSAHSVPPDKLADYLTAAIPSLLAYVTSFFLVWMYWLQHYVIFHYLTRATRLLVAINSLFLLTVSVLPYPTGLKAAYRHDELAVVLFGLVNVACSGALLLLWQYATRGRRLVAADMPAKVIRSITLRIAISPAMSLLAMAVSYVSIHASTLIFVVIPLFYLSHRTADEYAQAAGSK